MKQNFTEKGSALIYILIAIALMAALTTTFMKSDSQQSRSQNSFKLATEITSQINFIRTAIDECTLLYPAGADDLVGVAAIHSPYPVNPNASYFDGTSLDGLTTRLVKDIACPGNPGNTKEHVKIFGSTKNLPPPPSVLDEWVYYNANTTIGSTVFNGVYISIASSNTDPYIAEAFNKVDSQFSDCEVDVVDSTADDCSDTACLRYWIYRVAPACP